jgi:hypothetical protein
MMTASTQIAQASHGVGGPQILELADEASVDIAAESHLHYGFILKRGSGCAVTGRVLGLAGGNKDIEVLLLGDDDFINWKQKPRAPEMAQIGYYHSPRQTATTLNLPVPGPGQYHLVISNAFSFATPKTVQVKAKLVCTGTGDGVDDDAGVWAEARRELSAADRERLVGELRTILRDLMTAQESYFSDYGRYASDIAKLRALDVPRRIKVDIREATAGGWFATAHVVGATDLICANQVGNTRSGSPTANEGEVVCRGSNGSPVTQTGSPARSPAVAPAAPSTARVPTHLSIANENAQEIGPGYHVAWSWKVNGYATCRVQGRVLGLAGGNKDVDVMLMDEDGFINFKNNTAFKVYFQSRPQAAVTIDVVVRGTGTYVFVISNTHSLVTGKTVQVQNVRATCAS